MAKPKITRSGDDFLVEYKVLKADAPNGAVQELLSSVHRQNVGNMGNESSAEGADDEIARLTALKADRILMPAQI